jgi:hypothetical protein
MLGFERSLQARWLSLESGNAKVVLTGVRNYSKMPYTVGFRRHFYAKRGRMETV